MIIAVRRGDLAVILAPVDRFPELEIGDVNRFGILRIGKDMAVVPGTLDQIAVIRELRPGRTAVVRAIDTRFLIFRFDDRDLEAPAAFGKNLSWFLDTRTVSARDKNMVMNLVWDAVASSHAMRVELFEESNALNVPFLLERVYNEYDRDAAIAECRAVIGLATDEKQDYVHEIEQTWADRKKRGEY